MLRTVEKVAAVCFLDAVKQVMEQVAERRLQVGRAEDAEGRALTDTYHRARRLRDHLQRRAGAFQDSVQVELDREDQALLVACCRHFVQHLEARLERSDDSMSRNDRAWVQHRSEILAKWAVELAEHPAYSLPLPKPSQGRTAVFRGMENSVLQKLGAPIPAEPPPDAGQVATAPQQDSDPWRPPVARKVDQKLEFRIVASGASSGTPRAAEPVTGPGSGSQASTSSALAEVRALLVQAPQQLRDPRLRNAMSLDLRSYRRAHAENDLRAAALLLTILLETAIVDYALVHGEELGLGKSPEGWSFLDLLKTAVGTPVTPRARVLAHQLMAARNLSRPAMQLLAPHAVTSASLDSMEEFVCQLLRNLGFSEQEVAEDEAKPAESPIRGDGLDRFL